MNTYKIYKLNPNVIDLIEQYPDIKNKIINIEPQNNFFTKQMECLFGNNEGVGDFIEYKLKDRYDYTRNKNKHIINNQLTNETLICEIHDYYIFINANKKSNIFLDILYQISKRYVIILEQSKNSEV